MKIDDVAAQIEALGNPTRLKLYRTLVMEGRDGIPVGQLQRRLGTAASTLSHHLQKMIQVGLVTQERQATTLICRANYEKMGGLAAYLTEECCAEQRECRPSGVGIARARWLVRRARQPVSNGAPTRSPLS